MDLFDMLKLANQPGVQAAPMLVIGIALLYVRRSVKTLKDDQVRGFTASAAQHRALEDKVDRAVHVLGKDLALLRLETKNIGELTKAQEQRLREMEIGCARRHANGGGR